jgi:hypothetical protein
MTGHARIAAVLARRALEGRVRCGRSAAKRHATRANRSCQGLYAQKMTRLPVLAQLWLANGAGTNP